MKFPISNLYTYSKVNNPKWLIIFVHWLTGSQDEEMFVQWERFFNENWYSTLRFNLYWDWSQERKLIEVCLQDNIDDVNAILGYCSKLWYKAVFLVWHSYGGVVNLYVDHSNLSWLLMRDSSIWWKWLLKDVHEDWKWWYYIDRWDWFKHYVSEKYYEDFQIPSEKFLEKMSEITIPVKIIWAENWLADAAKRYFESANDPKELNIILKAYHRFLGWWMDELLRESLEWINKN